LHHCCLLRSPLRFTYMFIQLVCAHVCVVTQLKIISPYRVSWVTASSSSVQDVSLHGHR
jgi:hypothetical protein